MNQSSGRRTVPWARIIGLGLFVAYGFCVQSRAGESNTLTQLVGLLAVAAVLLLVLSAGQMGMKVIVAAFRTWKDVK
jgi:hypothetical protein